MHGSFTHHTLHSPKGWKGLAQTIASQCEYHCGGTALKFLRIVFFYVLFFFVSFVIAGIFIRPISDGYFVLFSFFAPVIMVWWYERRRARRLAKTSLVQPEAAVPRDFRTPSVVAPATTLQLRMTDQVRPSTDTPSPKAPGFSRNWQKLDLAAVAQKNREVAAELAARDQSHPSVDIPSASAPGNSRKGQELNMAAVLQNNREIATKLAATDQPRPSADAPSANTPGYSGNWQKLDLAAVVQKNREVAARDQPLPSGRAPSASTPGNSGKGQELDMAAVVRNNREVAAKLAANDQPHPSADAPPANAPGNSGNLQQLDLAAVVQKNRELAAVAAQKEAERMAQGMAFVTPALSLFVPVGEVSHPRTEPQEKYSQHQGWVAKAKTVSVCGRDIGGMVYVGTPPTISRHGFGEKCRAYIDPTLSVARVGNDKAGTGMPYWPSYSSIPPECRATYLEWLAAGRADGSYNPGYMFLYFYGLERRFFVDSPSLEEKRDLLDEARRLVEVFSDNYSAQRYLREFIEFALVAITEFAAIQPVFENPGWDVPFSVKLAIGARLQNGENLDSDWVLSWFLCHPEKNLRTSAKRCRDEFTALFGLRFNERFPQGLKVTKPRTTLKANYEAASREFEGSVTPTIDGKTIPDISSLRKPIEIAQEIADAAMEDLEKFSRFLGRNPEGRGSVEAHALLPAALRQMFPSKELDEIKTWAGAIVQAGGLVPVRDVLERLEGERAEQLGKRQLTGAADALARIGFGMAPDPRFALRSPALNEPVVLFDLGGPVEQLEDVSTPYKAALMELALATFVAHADGAISEIEKTKLEAQTRSAAQLTDHEQKRLWANLSWFIAVPPDLTLLRRKLKETGADQQSAIRAALVAAAHADGIVSTEEVAGIEKIYRALGLDPNLVYSDLHAGEVPDTPMRVRLAQPGAPGEAIPAEPQASAQRLDAARIASIRQDTDRVSAVLANIFTTDTPDDDESTATPSALAGLDAKHTALVRDVITRPHWTEEDFVELTARHGLMAAGALETVNEWAFGVHDEALLEEYEGYDVSPDIADALADTFDKEK